MFIPGAPTAPPMAQANPSAKTPFRMLRKFQPTPIDVICLLTGRNHADGPDRRGKTGGHKCRHQADMRTERNIERVRDRDPRCGCNGLQCLLVEKAHK